MKLTKKKIIELEKELEVRIYNECLYRKMCGSWDICVEFDEDTTNDFIEEKEEGENLKLYFKVTAKCYEEGGGHSDWWNIKVEVDDKYKIIKIECVKMKEKKYGRYEFTITIAANGKSPDEAWTEAVNAFCQDDGGCPDDYKFEEEDE